MKKYSVALALTLLASASAFSQVPLATPEASASISAKPVLPSVPFKTTGTATVTTSCSVKGCELDIAKQIAADIKSKLPSTSSRFRQNLDDMINALYLACPLGSNWEYRLQTIKIGTMAGSCVTSPEPGKVVEKTAAWNGAPNRLTIWRIQTSGAGE